MVRPVAGWLSMPHPKRTIPLSEVKVGDSFCLALRSCQFGIDAHGRRYAILIGPGEPFSLTEPAIVGFTNRKAKRARGKMARRERLRDDASFRRMVSRALRTIPAIRLANELAVSRSTVIRWSQGASVPHPAMQKPVRSAIARLRSGATAEVLA